MNETINTYGEGPASGEGAAMLSVLVNSRPWNIGTFKALIETVMQFRCKHSWEKKSRKTITGMLEEKRETFADLIDEMAREAETFSEYADEYDVILLKRYRSGFEFLLDDFPDQLGFCEYLPSLNHWDYCLELRRAIAPGYDGTFYLPEPITVVYDQLDFYERPAMKQRLATHFWWHGYMDSPMDDQHSLQEFVLKSEQWITDGLEGDEMNQMISQNVAWFDDWYTISPRRHRFAEFHLRNLKPYWKPYFVYQASIEDISKCAELWTVRYLCIMFPDCMDEIDESDEYWKLAERLSNYYDELERQEKEEKCEQEQQLNEKQCEETLQVQPKEITKQ